MATRTLSPQKALIIANGAIADLDEVVKNGLDPAYENVRDFLCDFWPNFPWDEAGSKQVFALILENSDRMKIVDAFDKKFDLDKPLPMGAPNEDSIRYGLENPDFDG